MLQWPQPTTHGSGLHTVQILNIEFNRFDFLLDLYDMIKYVPVQYTLSIQIRMLIHTPGALCDMLPIKLTHEY